MKIECWDVITNGPFTEKAALATLEECGCIVTRCEYPAGVFLPERIHDMDKVIAIISGRLRVEASEWEAVMEKGFLVHIPRRRVYSVRAVGDDPVVCFDGAKC